MNQFIEPAKEETGQSDFLQGVASSLLEALVRLTISPQGLCLNQIDRRCAAVSQVVGYRQHYQLFEASMKRTNAMVSQGRWLEHLGAAISFSRCSVIWLRPLL